MGLGKTVQSIALLAHLAEVREREHRAKSFVEYPIVFAVVSD